ncbi:MAG: hypothetical protein M1833_005053 [Piccolia ochrophora]|nr:MAG: hypothetical protein M1833_005053 [Piccolia ochrophora]
MLRLRRYRAFVAFAVFAILALYQFRNGGRWDTGLSGLDPILGSMEKEPHAPQSPVQEGSEEKQLGNVEHQTTHASATPIGMQPPLGQPLTPSSDAVPTSNAPSLPSPSRTFPPYTPSAEKPGEGEAKHIYDEIFQQGQGRVEPIEYDSSTKTIYWSKLPEHFPIPSESVIALPTEKPKQLPKIQGEAKAESASAKADREQKLEIVKEAFTHAWKGYKKSAWMHDELTPVSGGFKDPFCGWAATLVDSLDTLWIMGLKEDFEDAVKAVNDINFKTALRNDIPLFETVIRYLGGLLAAYDISDAKYRTLLDKAVELAEILMGAFDTPNRMPMTFYNWKPTFASQPHRASSRIVLAELGSLSVEFTRLAQLTKEARYYDAIARITNALEIWQNNTNLPGMFPTTVDGSGCKKKDHLTHADAMFIDGPDAIRKVAEEAKAAEKPAEKDKNAATLPKNPTTDSKDSPASKKANAKRQLNNVELSNDAPEKGDDKISDNAADANGSVQPKKDMQASKAGNSESTSEAEKAADIDCEVQGLTSPLHQFTEIFTLGGQSDSLFEYLPKEYMLLGGVKEQYRVMYETAIDVVKERLLFRPLNKDNRNLLISGDLAMSGKGKDRKTELQPRGTHLTCFAGGMFAIAAKIFDREDDLDLASKLTDGCIWAYESTNTGVMPEKFTAVPCNNTDCSWNETLYWDALDPGWRPYQEQILNPKENQQEVLQKKGSFDSNDVTKEPSRTSKELPREPIKLINREIPQAHEGAVDGEKPKDSSQTPSLSVEGGHESADGKTSGSGETTPKEGGDQEKHPPLSNDGKADFTEKAEDYVIPSPPTHEEFVQARVRDERLPPGFVGISDKSYILRPEAIESVFIMYRITGDEYWRKKGWVMFQAIQKFTRTEHGHTAIADVTSTATEKKDSMESFWLAETLKYFYLLFSDMDVVSLDDYVLNTEAHPFKRPHVE